MTTVESVLLRGRCRFEFESHEFVPAGEAGSFEDACWLHASPDVKQKLASLLGVDHLALEIVGWIEMAFNGHLSPVRGHYGHFGIFSREATIHDVIEARVVTSPVLANRTSMSIRERLQKKKAGH